MLAELLNILVWILAMGLLVPLATFALECLFALRPLRFDERQAGERHPAIAVLIPAHNEEAVIAQTLETLSAVLGRDDRVVVVADHCDDQTAALARAAGAEVLEHTDAKHCGKGSALQHGLDFLKRQPPAVVVILDADCLVTSETVHRLAVTAHTTGRPVQGLNLTDRGPAAASLQVLAVLANRFTNLIRPWGLKCLGLPCRLMGTGMAFPWVIASTMRPVGGHLVEDLQLGIDLTRVGRWTEFCPAARVTSALPPQDRAFASQRRRWEHGYLRTVVPQVPRLLLAAIGRGNLRLFALALDLSIPPLALMLLASLGGVLVAAAAGIFGLSWRPFFLLAGGGVLASATFLAAWAVHCRRQVPLSALAAIPYYIVKKVPIYLGFLLRPQRTWVRTERETAPSTDSPE